MQVNGDREDRVTQVRGFADQQLRKKAEDNETLSFKLAGNLNSKFASAESSGLFWLTAGLCYSRAYDISLFLAHPAHISDCVPHFFLRLATERASQTG
jgi:hypothetical protein